MNYIFLGTIFAVQIAGAYTDLSRLDFASCMVNCERMQDKLDVTLKNQTYQDYFLKFERSFQKFVAIKKKSSDVVIPKIIHQIWVGKKTIPARCKEYMQKWKEMFPDWTYILWTDSMVASVPFMNHHLFTRSVNMGEKSDILRYELLYYYGGLYVDIDFEPLDPAFFEYMHQVSDFYAGILPPEEGVVVNNALIGCKAGHSLMLDIINALRTSWYKSGRTVDRTGPEFMTSVLATSEHFEDGCNVILPSSMLYPFSWEQTDGDLTRWIKPETVAIHYFAGTWYKL